MKDFTKKHKETCACYERMGYTWVEMIWARGRTVMAKDGAFVTIMRDGKVKPGRHV
ncbi:MAG: hypothetical protein JEY79_17955 [Pseudodesulfovibrio sp.]|nr:hypothetical protein [Pseudodesulfovibrio sp.]